MKSFLRRNRLAYMIGIPIVAFLHFHLFLNAFGTGFAAGVAGDTIPFIHIAAIFILGFPFIFAMPVFASMRPLLDDNQMLYVATVLSGIFWGFVVVSIICLMRGNLHKENHQQMPNDHDIK